MQTIVLVFFQNNDGTEELVDVFSDRHSARLYIRDYQTQRGTAYDNGGRVHIDEERKAEVHDFTDYRFLLCEREIRTG